MAKTSKGHIQRQAGVRLLPPWQGGLVFAAWAAALAAAGAVMTARRDIT